MKTYTYNFKKYFYKFFVFLLFFIAAIGTVNVKAAVKVNYKELVHGESKEQIKIQNIYDGFNIDIDNTIEEDGHTTAYFSPSKVEEVYSYSGFSFHISNKSEDSIKLNFIINEENSNNILENGVNVFTKDDNAEEIQLLTVDNGVFELEKNFSGNVYIPFTSLGKNKFDNIKSWGLTLTLRNGEKKNYDISSFAYLEKKDMKNIIGASKFCIEGDRELPVLPVGEAIVDYKINDDHKYKFYLKDNYEGVSLSENGHLAVNSLALPSDIKVFVEDERGFSFYFKVRLRESLTKGLKGVTDKSLATPSYDEVVNGNNFITQFFMNSWVIITIRALCIAVVLCSTIVYFYWRGYLKNTKDKENMEE